ncbi:uncharacterized protein LOC62_02G001876 [Vanrija pseudolonga]|uniref:Uncharacterized protein n=1 Tax=Vanrija pseudolonga TaxID=143232 RepID=A0AAF1BJG3_9TREE|nr:hypothetical protein LOC62_02G001876 [Vanrija pseudolonga]
MSTVPAKRARISEPNAIDDALGSESESTVNSTTAVNATPHTPESLAALLVTASRTDILALLLDPGVAHPDVAESVEAFASNLRAPAPDAPETELHVPAQPGAVAVTCSITEAVPTSQLAEIPAASGSGEPQVPNPQATPPSVDDLREHDFKRSSERARSILALFREKGRTDIEDIKPYMAVIALDISEITVNLDQHSSYAHKFSALKHLTDIFLTLCPQDNWRPSRMIRAVCEIDKWGLRLRPVKDAFTPEDCVRLAAEDGGHWLRDKAAEIQRFAINDYGVFWELKKTYSSLVENAQLRS